MTGPKVETLPATATKDEIMAVINRDGAVILKDVLTAEQVAKLNAEIGPYVDATEEGRDDFTGRHTTRTGALVARSAMCREMVMNDAIRGAVGDFLLPNCEGLPASPDPGDPHQTRPAGAGHPPGSLGVGQISPGH